ncbi:MAG: efflux RND transporter periplasmic adaptor subunit [Rhizobiales bacterium]|nr:efflux RND transporter periplasmic adaptor subunit [Hyphomicrobiales bacterium]
MAFSNDRPASALLSAPDTDLDQSDPGPAEDRPTAHQARPLPTEAKATPGRRDEPAARPGKPARRSKAGRALAGVIILLAAGGGYAGWSWWSKAKAPPPAAAVVASIPVEAATAVTGDVPVYFRGLGTVQAFNTVTIKARVDGQLQTVAFTEGQQIKRGELIAQIDPRPYQAAFDQAVAKKVQDEAQLGNAKLDLQRYTDLAKNNFGTRQQLDTQRALVAQLEATIRVDQGAIDAAKVQLDYTTIASPIDGVAGIRLVDAGNIVHASDTGGIVVVTQMQPISIVFTLPEEDRPEVAAAMAAGPVEVAALARDGTGVLDRGTVLLIDNEIDQATGTMRLKATFPNPQNKLWPGQFVNVRLLLRTEHGVVTVPSAAIERGPAGFYAYVVKPDATVDMRTLAVGQDQDGLAVVRQGLAAGERVVTGGQYRLQPGALVAVEAGGGAAAGTAPAEAATASQRTQP